MRNENLLKEGRKDGKTEGKKEKRNNGNVTYQHLNISFQTAREKETQHNCVHNTTQTCSGLFCRTS